MKSLRLFTIMTVMLAALSSCLKNEEPGGIKNLRDATAELINAEAQYQIAQIALIEADANLKAKAIEGKKLENKMKEIEIENKNLDIQYREAEIAHEKKMMELELALEQQKNEKEIAALQNEIFELEVEMLDMELEKLKKEQEKELMVKTHEKEMIEAQLAVAQAEADYEEALRKIAAASQGLTAEEQEKLNGYNTKINQIRNEINTAEIALIQAQSDYVDAKYNYDFENLKYTYETALAKAKSTLEADKDALAKAEAIDLKGGSEAWIAQRDAINEEIASLEKDIAALEVQAKEMELEKEAPEKEIAEIIKQINAIDEEYTTLENEMDNVHDKIFKERKQVTLRIPAGALSNVKDVCFNINQILSAFSSTSPDDDGATDIKTFVRDNNGNYTLPDGEISWIAAEEVNLKILEEMKSLLETKPYGLENNVTIENLKYNLEAEKYRFESSTGSKATYFDNLEIFNKATADSRTLSEEYGLLNGVYTENNLLNKAIEAYNLLMSTSSPSDENLKIWIGAIYKEQQVRHKLSGMAYSGWEKITFENYTSDAAATDHIDNTTLYDAVYHSFNNTIENNRFADSGTDKTKWSANEAWYKSSMNLYGLGYVKSAFDPETTFEGRLNWVYYLDNYNYILMFDQKLADILSQLGYSSIGEYSNGVLYCPELENSAWFKYNSDSLYIRMLGLVVDNFDDFKELYDNITVAYEEKSALSELENQEAVGIMTQMRDLLAQRQPLMEQYGEAYEKISEIDEKINDLITGSNSQKGIIESHIRRITDIRDVLEDLIEGVEIEIDGAIYTPDDENLQEAYQTWITSLQDAIAASEEAVRLAQNKLDRLNASEDPEKFAVDTAAKELEQAEETYDRLIEEFNFYNKLLQEFLSQLTA